jgi:hypothetical protein
MEATETCRRGGNVYAQRVRESSIIVADTAALTPLPQPKTKTPEPLRAPVPPLIRRPSVSPLLARQIGRDKDCPRRGQLNVKGRSR